jgi:cob(I)alamin adenosyltransferase
MVKIYTKSGDYGKTSLYDGGRVDKSDFIVEALGCVDELSSHIGMLVAIIEAGNRSMYSSVNVSLLRTVQSCLQNLGSVIATPSGKKAGSMTGVHISNTQTLENAIDSMELSLPNLTSFILPGVTVADAQAHVCRSACRKAERAIVHVNVQTDQIIATEEITVYINRLSDYFFVLARHLCFISQKAECFYKDYPPCLK